MPTVKDVGEPCEEKPHARFDGGREETNASRQRRHGARRLPPTRPLPDVAEMAWNLEIKNKLGKQIESLVG
jgi:hypothetical protein